MFTGRKTQHFRVIFQYLRCVIAQCDVVPRAVNIDRDIGRLGALAFISVTAFEGRGFLDLIEAYPFVSEGEA